LKLPKKRGFRNKIKSEKTYTFGLGEVQKAYLGHSASGKVVIDRDTLREVGLISSKFQGTIKILDSGEIKFPVTVKRAILVSKGAAEKITAAGGTIVGER
jgi:ribosomal protein L15